MTGPKYAVYLSYAAENEHGRNHVAYYRYVRKDLQYGPLDPELAGALNRKTCSWRPRRSRELTGAYIRST